MRNSILTLFAGVCVVLVGCDATTREPVAPRAMQPTEHWLDASTGDASLATIGGGGASGRVDVHGTTLQNIDHEVYSFTAVSAAAFPAAHGQVEAHFNQFTGAEVDVHAEVTCLAIVNDQAWIGARVTRFVLNGELVPERTGGPMVFRVQDVGEGQGVADRAALLFFGRAAADGDLTYCNTHSEADQPRVLFESANGNVQVRPE